MKELKIEVPNGYEVDKELSTFEKIVFKKIEIDFSLLNGKDFFYIKTNNNNEWLYNGKNPEEKDNSINYDLKNKKNCNEESSLCRKKNVIELRLATKEEIEDLKKNLPDLFKPKWKDFGKIEGYFVSSYSNILNYNNKLSESFNKNLFPTKEEAEACLALSQLCQWRDKYNEGWKPDWSDNEIKYIIYFSNNKIFINGSFHNSCILSFKTEKIRNKFYKNFKDLIEIAKPLL